MTIYEELLSRVEQGEKFSINFEKRNMKVGKDWLIKNGKCETGRILYGYNPIQILELIESLYEDYKYSCPSERSDSRRKGYFKALSVDDLSDDEMVYGEPREYAQAKVEGFILCAIICGKFKWDEEKLGKWFWQSKTDSDLVILKNWVENK